MSKYKPLDFSKVSTFPIKQRKSKVNREDFAKPHKVGDSFASFIDSLPYILVADQFRAIVGAIAKAYQQNKPVIVMMGGHIVKCGLSPILIDLMGEKVITALAMNGAGAIHDFEIAMFGATSEDVAENLADGSFGMAKETAEFMNAAMVEGMNDELGLGEALALKLLELSAEHYADSLLIKAYKLGIPVTVHVAVGTDIIHQHPNLNPKALGDTTYRDFRIFTGEVAKLGNGGVVLNLGSAVIMPEVFLKALTVARNLGYEVDNFTSANFDMIQHYRPKVNVLQRPTASKGRSYAITGHHEIMIPLLAAAVKEKIKR